MTEAVESAVRVLVGYDGSMSATTAIQAAARLLPGAKARLVYLWESAYDFPELRHRVTREAGTVAELTAALEREGLAEARRVAALGVAVAQPEGWTAESWVQSCYGGVGYQFSRLAEQHNNAMVVVGAHGVSGLNAMLGTVSDVLVQVSSVPVLVVPHPLTTTEWAATADGPVLIGYDGSKSSTDAHARACDLFAGRHMIQARVRNADDHETDDVDTRIVTLRQRGHGAHGIADTLCAYARQRHAGVIVVGSSGRSTGVKSLLGSVAKAVAHHAQRPVLIVPTGQRLS